MQSEISLTFEQKKILDLEEEIKQLKAALRESRAYSDKLVANIPYLPADLENSRAANLALSGEVFTLKEYVNELRLKLGLPADTIEERYAVYYKNEDAESVRRLTDNFMDDLEFPGPYSHITEAGTHKIMAGGRIVAKTPFKEVAEAILATLNTLRENKDLWKVTV